MKDILGNEIDIGDVVVVNDKEYSNLKFARVYRLTPKRFRCFYVDFYSKNLNQFVLSESIYDLTQILKLTEEQLKNKNNFISNLFNNELIAKCDFTLEEKQKLFS